VVDNRSAGFYGIGGAFNFKSGDISGTAANTQDDKMGPGTEYGAIPDKEEEQNQNTEPFVDRSAQLRATLNSLAMMNVASVLNEKKRMEILKEIEDSDKTEEKKEKKDDLDEEFLNDFDDLNFDSDDEDDEYY
jgi:hypothetical protein